MKPLFDPTDILTVFPHTSHRALPLTFLRCRVTKRETNNALREFKHGGLAITAPVVVTRGKSYKVLTEQATVALFQALKLTHIDCVVICRIEDLPCKS